MKYPKERERKKPLSPAKPPLYSYRGERNLSPLQSLLSTATGEKGTSLLCKAYHQLTLSQDIKKPKPEVRYIIC